MSELDPNQMWEIIRLVISENVEANEAITTYGAHCVQLSYSSIVNNSLKQSSVVLDKKTLCLMTIPTLRMFIVEVINKLRSKEGIV